MLPELLALCLAAAAPSLAQQPPRDPVQERLTPAAPQEPEEPPPPWQKVLPELVVTATRAPRDPFELPRSVIVADREHLARRSPASVLDALNRSIGIWVEKRTATTSDPVIRGVAGANLLLLVDGNNITTFWGEGGYAGDDLYGKVDAESIERIEVIRGPASVQYGSNALGGVINYITRHPRLEYPSEGAVWGGRVKGLFGSVNTLGMARWDQELAVPDFRVRAGATLRDMQDGQGGAGVGTLKPSRGRESNFDWSGEYRLDPESELFFSGQEIIRRGTKRFYRPEQTNDNDRTAAALGWRHRPAADPETSLEARIFYQWKEDRRDFGGGVHGRAWWRTFSGDLIGQRRVAEDHLLVAGLSLRQDKGESPGDEQFTRTFPDGSVRKQAPDQTWRELGVFLQDDWEVAPWLTAAAGARYGFFHYRSKPDPLYVPPGNIDPEFDRYDRSFGTWTGGVGLTARVSEEWRVYGSWARGYRFFEPIFGLTLRGFGYVAPSGWMDPITADQYEIGIRHRSRGIESSLALFYTDFSGFQNPVPGSFEGQTSINGTPVFVTAADGDAIYHGVEWELRLDPHHYFEAIPQGIYTGGGFAWNYGRDLTNREPMRHTHPARGLFVLGYQEPEERRWYAECTADFVRRFTRVQPSRLVGDSTYRRDPQDMTSPLLRQDGLPGYSVFDLHAGWHPREDLRVGLVLENLTNKKYRPAHNRMDAFGFNAMVFAELTF